VPLLGLRFPNYRNLEPGSYIDFEFPITVLLGRNGTNKSSVLHALYGAAKRNSVGEFWFETKLDAIPEVNSDGLKQSVAHRYVTPDGEEVECIKARAPRGAKDPDYWETVKPTQAYGFRPGARRRSPINIPVLHVDFRGQLPAFDRYFYFPDRRHLEHLAKNAQTRGALRRSYRPQDYLRRRTDLLKRKLDLHGEALTETELSVLSFVLDRNYASGVMLEHDLFHGHVGHTILFRTDELQSGYSEAFAGSGESAAVMLIHKIESAPNGSLVLLDEPESSLHPSAQQRMLGYLADRALSKQLQIVISSHSIYFAGPLPRTAIRVLRHGPSGRVIVDATMTAREALHEFADVPPGRTILVEDERAKAVVLTELRVQCEGAEGEFCVRVRAGGTSRIYRDIKAHANAEASGLFVVLDGDQKPARDIPPKGKLPNGKAELEVLIGELTKGNDESGPGLDFVNEDECRRYIEFLRNRVCYLPGKTPEELVWSDQAGLQILGEAEPSARFRQVTDEMDMKKRISKLAALDATLLDDEHVFKSLLSAFLKSSSDKRKELKVLVSKIRDAE
jgi:predicted ATPase